MNVVWALVFFASGGAILAYGLGLVRDARRCSRWPRAEGSVLAGEVSGVSRQKGKTHYAPDVRFSYVVAGKRYDSSRLTLVPRNYLSRDQAAAAISRYPVGATIHVSYDPDDPSNCVLEARAVGSERAYPLGGLLLIGVGVLFLLPA